MQKAPARRMRQARTRRFPRRTSQLSSERKSTATSSTREAYTRRPAEIAFMVPTRMRPKAESGL